MTPQSSSLSRRLPLLVLLGLAFPLVFTVATSGSGAGQWSNLNPSNPPAARFGHTLVSDSASDRVIMFGGGANCAPLGDTWLLTNASGQNGAAAWTQLAPAGTGPDARWHANAVYDAATNRMVVFGGAAGGYCAGAPPLRNDVWVLSNANGLGGAPAWSQLLPSGAAPPAMGASTSVYDAVSNRLIVFGGNRNIGNCFFETNATWILTFANGVGGSPAWIQVSPTGGPPIARFNHTAVYDAAANQMIVSGGQNSCGGTLYSDTWALAHANGLGGTPTWIALAPFGQSSHTAVIDAAQHRMLSFAGSVPAMTNSVRVMSGTDATTGQAWSNLATTGPLPSPRSAHGAVFDDVRQTMIVFGGNGPASTLLNDTWALTFASATTLSMPAATGTFGGSATITATLLASGAPVAAAAVEFFVSGVGVGSATTDNDGVATLTNVSLAGRNAGSYPGIVTATFAGMGGLQASNAAADLTVDRAPVWIVVSGGGVFTYDGTGHAASGAVSGALSADLGPAAIVYEDLSNASQSATVPVDAGSYRVIASFAGDTNHLGGSNNSSTIIIDPANTTTNVSSDLNPSRFGQMVTFTAKVTAAPLGPNPSTGTITFKNGAATLGSGAVDASGQATFATAALSAAGSPHAITATYGGSVNFAAGTSLPLAQVVTPDTTPPTTTAVPYPAANAAGWNNTNVTVTLTATEDAGGSGVQSITYNLNGQQSGSGTIPGSVASVPLLFAEGTTTVRYYATDNHGNVESEQALSIRIDKTPPLLSYPSSVTVQATSSAGATVTFFVSGSDSLSGLSGPVAAGPFVSGATFPLGSTTQTVQATDLAGNLVVRTFNVVVNPGRPNVVLSGGTFNFDGNPHPATAVARDQAGNPIAGTFSFSYLPGGSAPVAPGIYSAAATFTSSDPAFANAMPWMAMAPDPHAKVSPAVAEINGNLYVHGFDQDAVGNQGSFVPRLSIYNPFANTWSIGASPAIVRAFASAVAMNGKLYVVGGCVMSDCRIGVDGARVLEIYDPVSNTWSTGAPMPSRRYGAAAGVIGNKLYIAGGGTECPPCGTTTSTEIYDPVSNTWTAGAPIPMSRELATGAVANGRLYVMGGSSGGAPLARVDVYEPVAGTWTSAAAMPTARSGAAAGTINGRIHVAGGASGQVFVSVNESYDPASNTWTQQAAMPSGRTYLSGGVAGQRLFVIDGSNGAQVNTVEAFDPSLTTVITINPGDTTPPTTTANYQSPNAYGWHRFNVNVSLNANDPCCATPSSGVQSITYALSGAQVGGGTFAGNSASFNISSEGTTIVTYRATDNRGNVEAEKSFVIRLDKTQPSAASFGNITASATSTAGAVVMFDLAASDGLSGIDTVVRTQGMPSGSTFPHGSTSEAFTITDRAGNSIFRNFSVTVNKTLLSIAVSPTTASVAVGSSQSFTATGHFTSGPDQVLPTSGGGGGGGGGTGVPAGATWQLHFTPGLNVSACASVPGGFSSQGISPNAAGAVVNQLWGNGNTVQVNGTVTLQQVELTIACNPGNGAAGTLSATWTGTRYQGSATFSGSTTAVSIAGWSTKASMPTARAAFGAATVNGIVYAMGGGDPNQPQPVDAFDPATNAWSTVSQMQTSREGAAVAALNGKIYVAGGHVSGGAASGVLESYDPSTNAWTTLPSMPTARAHLALVAAGGRLYAIGGDTLPSNMGLSRVVESYDPSTNAWTTRASTATARNFIVGGALNTETMIVVAGGPIAGTSTELYDVASDMWTVGPAMLSPVGGMAATVVNNALFVFGGFSSSGGLTLAHMFRPAGNGQPAGWAAMSAMPSARNELAAAAVGDVIYTLGGKVNGQSLATVEAFHTPPPFDFMVSSGGSGGGGGGSSLPTVSWQTSSPSIAGITGSGVATGAAPGQTTIVATASVNGSMVSCATTNTCALLTVTAPVRLTLTLAPGSVVFPSVQVTASRDDETEGPFTVFFDQPNDPEAGPLRLLFTAPAGYTVTPSQVDLQLEPGDDITIALLFAAIDTTPPALSVSGNLTVEATSAGGAMVTFMPPTATDASGVQSVSCDRGSGETFGLGVTTVQCSATDTAGNVAHEDFTVTVQDTTPPALSLPSDLVTDATSPAGATAVFTVSASDLVDGARPVTCAPASGAVFAIGLTTVSCTSADTRGNVGTGGFTVTVRSAAQIVVDLAAEAAGVGFGQGGNLLQNALASIASGNTGASCGQLGAFINQVQAQAGKKLSVSEAAALVAAANSAKAALGCP